jgi:arylsulfatase A
MKAVLNMHKKLITLGLLIGLIIVFKAPGNFVLSSDSPALSSDKPNIVLFFIDDWAWNGSTVQMDDEVFNSYIPSLLEMPNLDKLAVEGMIFSNAYSGAPQCSPSRVALQTGQSSPRNGFTVFMNDGGSDYYDPNKSYSRFPVVPNVSDMTIDPEATTIPEALAPHGYASAHIGKWHMRGHPDYEGYIMNDGPTTNKEGNQQIPDDPKLTFSLTDSALVFIEEQANNNKPFYVQLSYYAMHAGSECLAETRAEIQKRPEMQAYYKSIGETAQSINYKQDPATWMGMAEDLDGTVGVVLDKLKELGIEDNTYVILTADNGYRHDFYDELFLRPQPLHGAKWWLWQGGLRVPMVVKGPDVPAGTVCDENVVNYDFLPTFIDWAGGNPETELSDIDGVSLAPLMRGEAINSDFSNRTLYFHYPHYRNSMPHSVAIAGDKKVVHFWERPDIPMYFDVANDIGEVSNIAETDSAGHKILHDDMMQYLENVDARIPLYPNPDYDSLEYASSKEYNQRVLWGPFTGDRELEEDEYISVDKKLYQHLGAIRTAIVKDESNAVTKWSDQTIQKNHAIPFEGKTYYPSEQLFKSGLAGIDFGKSDAILELFSAVESDAFLDFNGSAAGNDGFALIVTFKADSLQNEWTYLVGNSIHPDSTNSFGILYNNSGIIEAFIGGEKLQGIHAISTNETVILCINYNASSGDFELVTSLGDELSTKVGKGDFSNASSLFLGGISAASGAYFNGLIGEVMVFDMTLSEEQIDNEISELSKMWMQPAEQKLVQHLDATVEQSVVTDETGLVSGWMDQSGNENHASPLVGATYFPAASKSKTGLAGIDFGNGPNKLELFSSDKSDAILDFTGIAAKNSGLSLFMAFKVDDIIDNQNDIMGNSTSVNDVNGFGLRYDSEGKPRVYAGGQKITLNDHHIQKDETIVYAVNYDKMNKLLKFWNSSSGTTETVILPPEDFSNSDVFALGGTGSGSGDNRYLDGMVGEVKVYNYSLSDSVYNEECKYLSDKWINGFSSGVYRIKDSLSKSDAKVNIAYFDSITGADFYNSENKLVQFSKISGPAWLMVAENGELTGTPGDNDLGENSFSIQLKYDDSITIQSTVIIKVISVTATEIVNYSSSISVYPNPVSQFVYFDSKLSGHYEVYDIICVKRMEGQLKKKLDFSNLKGGVYFLKLNGQVTKFLKQ